MVEYVSRAQWGARQPTRTPKLIPATQHYGVVLHWSGNAPISMDDPGRSHSLCDDDVRGLQAFHMDPKPRGRGWSDGAYSFYVCQHGAIYVCRGWDWDQFANGASDQASPPPGNDTRWYTVHFNLGAGGVPTREMVAAGERIVVDARRRGAGMQVRRHDEFRRKVCPGPDMTRHAIRLHDRPVVQPAPNDGGPTGDFPLPAGHAFGRDVEGNPAIWDGTENDATDASMRSIQREVGVEPDGEAGPDTDAGIKRWQGRYGLEADGRVGAATWAKMRAA